jgi:hypothetical protein
MCENYYNNYENEFNNKIKSVRHGTNSGVGAENRCRRNFPIKKASLGRPF